MAIFILLVTLTYILITLNLVSSSSASASCRKSAWGELNTNTSNNKNTNSNNNNKWSWPRRGPSSLNLKIPITSRLRIPFKVHKCTTMMNLSSSLPMRAFVFFQVCMIWPSWFRIKWLLIQISSRAGSIEILFNDSDLFFKFRLLSYLRTHLLLKIN